MKKSNRVKNGRITNEFKAQLVDVLWELKYLISKDKLISLNEFFRDRELGTGYAVAVRKLGVVEKISRGRYRWSLENSPNPEMAMMIYDKMHSDGKLNNEKTKIFPKQIIKEVKRPSTNSSIQDYKAKPKSKPKKENFSEKEISFLWGAFKYKRK